MLGPCENLRVLLFTFGGLQEIHRDTNTRAMGSVKAFLYHLNHIGQWRGEDCWNLGLHGRRKRVPAAAEICCGDCDDDEEKQLKGQCPLETSSCGGGLGGDLL